MSKYHVTTEEAGDSITVRVTVTETSHYIYLKYNDITIASIDKDDLSLGVYRSAYNYSGLLPESYQHNFLFTYEVEL